MNTEKIKLICLYLWGLQKEKIIRRFGVHALLTERPYYYVVAFSVLFAKIKEHPEEFLNYFRIFL